MKALEMKNITRVYDNVTVLNIESFMLEEGECVALVGSNGSGKTTLLNIAALLNTPTTGEIQILEKRVDAHYPDEHRAKVTLVAQEPFFFAGSLLRNITFGLNLKSLKNSNPDESPEKYLEMLDIQHLAKRSPRTFSSGEMKRAAIARALIRKTPLILLDEPFANVDSQSNSILEGVISGVKGKQSVLFSTHELSRAYEIADRIVSLQSGTISPWTPENLYRMKAVRINDGFMLVSDKNTQIYYPGELDENRTYTVSLNANEVFLSKDEVETSAQNRFKGIIKRIETTGKNLVGFTIQCSNDFVIKATITSRTVSQFDLSVNDYVWAHFKSSAIHVFK